MNRLVAVSRRSRTARSIASHMLHRVRDGVIEVTDPLARTQYGEPDSNATAQPLRAHVDVREPLVYERLLRGGSVGLGESYADGWWDTDNLTEVLRIALRSVHSRQALRNRLHERASVLIDPIARRRRPDPQRDARNVRAHYDLGNELFQRLLDETMAYSCAIFATPDTSLADASTAKFDRLAHMLDLSPGDRVLEIGTGWGGFAIHAAQRYDCSVTTTTLSQRQYQYASQRVLAAGLADRVTVLDADYRDLRGTFDKAVAIEMIEAVDWREYGVFFERMGSLLADDGALAMQAIVAPDHSFDRLKRHTDFIKAEIFPGGCLPSVKALTKAAMRDGGFALREHNDIGLHYGETLRRWRANLDRIAAELPALGLDERFARLWAFYFAYCEAGFEERYISTAQLLYATPGFSPRRASAPTRFNREPVSV